MLSSEHPVGLTILGSVFLPAEAMDLFADALRGRGHDVTVAVPSGRASGDAMLDAYAGALPGSVLIAHSNAGNFVPGVVARTPVAGALFMDAVLPPFDGGRWPVVPPRFGAALADRAEHGLLPKWTRWWPHDQVLALSGSAEQFARIDALAPRVSASYLDETVSARPGWQDTLPCGYLSLGDAYERESARAERAGWPTRRLAVGHLGMLSAPEEVAGAVEALLDELG